MTPGTSSTAQTDNRIRKATAVATLIVALASAVLSYAGLRTLGVESGINPTLALLLPACADGLLLVGALSVLDATISGRNAVYGWLVTFSGIGLSVWGNASVAPDVRSQVVHAIAPLSLAACIEGLMLTMRRRTVDVQVQETAQREAAERADRVRLAAEKKAASSVPVTSRKSRTGRRAYTDEHRQLVVDLKAREMKPAQIAVEADVDLKSVYRFLSEAKREAA